jgi:pimeloyl-ACP methyl ester carboxylesterase
VKPFRALALEALPERPRLSHPYYSLPERTVRVCTPALGALDAHVRVLGDGPPLLLLHGLMTAGYSWRYVVEPLARDFTVYIPDFPGAGRSAAPQQGRLSPHALSGWLSALVEALGIRGTAAIGNSMGGYLCMQWALLDPGAIGCLVNLHSPGFPESRLYALRTVMGIPGATWLLRRLVHSDPRRWVQRNVHYYDETLKSLEELDEYAAPLLTDGGLRAFAATLQQTMDPGPMRHFVRELEARRDAGRPFPVPLQLLFTAQDPIVPPSFGPRFKALIPDAELVVLQEGSHFAHVDAPEAFLAAVRPFLSAHAEPLHP